MTKVIALIVVALIFTSVGELGVQAMYAPTVMAHSQAHVMGYMCRTGRGPASRDADSPESTTDSAWRLLDIQTRLYFSQDPLIGVLEYLNKGDCEASARLLNRRSGRTRYICTLVRK